MLPPDTQSGSRRVVIVEDEGILALDIERHLRARGFEICGVAADSGEALRLVEECRPDLVLMDIRIQGERDGIETVAELKQRFDVPVVYLTAHSDPNTIERAQRTAPMGYLLKPFKKPDLDNVVQIALHRADLESRLRRREATLSSTLQCVDEAIFTTDASGSITYANHAAGELLGTSSTDLRSRTLSAVLPVTTSTGLSMTEVMGEARNRRTLISGQLLSPTGERNVIGTAAPLGVDDEPGVLIALRDLTEYVDLRKRLEQSERMAAVGLLAAGVAHEINNPLSVVISNLGFALTEPSLDHELREALRDARDAADRVSQIVGDLRPLTRPRTDEQRLIHPAQPLSIALHATRASWKSACAVKLELGPMPGVIGSATRLSQVLINVIENACHAMTGQSTPAPTLVIGCGTTTQGEAFISVTDTGPGVPDALRERIFEPFFTTRGHHQGTGLGLLVARGIAASHGGTLELAPHAGRGSTFTLILPAHEGSLPVEPTRLVWAAGRTPPPGPWTVLEPNSPTVLEELAWKGSRVVVIEPSIALRTMLRPWESALFELEGTERGVLSLADGFDPRTLAALGRCDD